MKSLWKYLSRTELGFILLVAASFNLFIGAVIAQCYPEEFRRLNAISLPQWFAEFLQHPTLYIWIGTLFLILFLLALNTLLCTITYIQLLKQSALSLKRIGIILFHFCFLCFLAGHFTAEFSGSYREVLLTETVPQTLVEEDMTLTALSIKKTFADIEGGKIPMGTAARIRIQRQVKDLPEIGLKTLRPAFRKGYSFHIAMQDGNLRENQIRIIVRQDYGLYFLMVGGLITLIALGLYLTGMVKTKPEKPSFQIS